MGFPSCITHRVYQLHVFYVCLCKYRCSHVRMCLCLRVLLYFLVLALIFELHFSGKYILFCCTF